MFYKTERPGDTDVLHKQLIERKSNYIELINRFKNEVDNEKDFFKAILISYIKNRIEGDLAWIDQTIQKINKLIRKYSAMNENIIGYLTLSTGDRFEGKCFFGYECRRRGNCIQYFNDRLPGSHY